MSPVAHARRRSRSRTGASTSTAGSTPRASRGRSGATSRPGRVVEGGSTITQQLVRTLYISNERTVERKVTEACLAVKLDDAWSKQQILASYLNSVFYGNLAYGAEAASRTYFSKPARWLTLPAGGAARRADPGAVDVRPVRGPRRGARSAATRCSTRCSTRRMITRGQYDWAPPAAGRAAAREALRADPRAVLLRLRPRPARQGLRRRDRALGRPAGLHDDRAALAAARAAGDPRDADARRPTPPRRSSRSTRANGAIRAMTAVVPGRANNQFNLLSQARRQPGSTFKTFVLAAAVERGLDPASTYYVSAPFTYAPDGDRELRRRELVVRARRTTQSYTGWTSVERATLRSDNSVYAQLTLDVGPRGSRRSHAGSACGRRSTVRGQFLARDRPRARSPSHRSTWLPRTRRSPQAASTRSRRRSAR